MAYNANDIQKLNDDIIKANADTFEDSDGYFYHLCRPGVVRKKRACLRCRHVFMSDGKRLCASCSDVKLGARAAI